MPNPVPAEYRCHSRNPRNFGALYIAITLLSFHWAMVIYVNSSFLEQYVSPAAIGVLYTVASAMTILIFLFISRVLRKIGNYKLTVALTIIELLVLIGMAFGNSLRVVIPLFLIHHTIIPLLLFNLDVYMERMIGETETGTGSKRGLYLTIMSFAGAVAPLLSGYLIAGNYASFRPVYIASTLFFLPFLYIIVRNFRTFSDPPYSSIEVLGTLRSFWIHKDIRNVFFAHFHLHLFFAWMVIYTPLYLSQIVGLSWSEIGAVLFVGLMAYVFLEYPIGVIADRYTGEKEMMFAGFIIMSLATASFAFLTEASVVTWMFIMFMTRVGASLVETTTESYFFKHTNGNDANIISFFRITRPLAYVIGALVASFILLYLSFSILFILLGLFMIPAMLFTLTLNDTK